MAKIRILTVLGLYSNISAAINVQFGTLTPCQISRLSGQRVAPAGRKTHFWTTV